MLARLLTKLFFGSEWALKSSCQPNANRYRLKFAHALYAYLQYENSSSIAWNSTFAGEPCFPHGMKSIFISGGARIGSDCVIFQQVTIGSNGLADSKGRGAPTIGDRCYIGAGAKIIGAVRIGDDVRVGANAVVVRDIPDRSVVLPADGIVLSKGDKQIDNRFYTYRSGWVYFSDGKWVKVDSPEILQRLERG